MISSVSYTPASSPTHSDSESESHLLAASAASVEPACKGGLRPTIVVNLGDCCNSCTFTLHSKLSSYDFYIYTVSEATLNDLKSGKNTLILQPLWQGNPEVATPKLVEEVIRTRRLFLRAWSDDKDKIEIFHDDSLGLRNVLISRIVTADLDTEAQVKAYPNRVMELVSGKTWLGKNKAAKCLVTRLSENFDRHIDRSKYTASTVSGIVEERFRKLSFGFQQALSSDPELIHKLVEEALGRIRTKQQKQLEERRRQQEEARKQEADAERRKAADKLANSLYWNAQQNAYIESIQKTSQNGYYTPVTSNLSYATARSVANGIAGIK